MGLTTESSAEPLPIIWIKFTNENENTNRFGDLKSSLIAVFKVVVVEQAPEFLVGFEFGFLMRGSLDRVLEIVVVDKVQKFRHE